MNLVTNNLKNAKLEENGEIFSYFYMSPFGYNETPAFEIQPLEILKIYTGDINGNQKRVSYKYPQWIMVLRQDLPRKYKT